MKTKTIALIGAGQIGSRHLQALAKCNFPVRLEIVDPNEASRKMSRERFDQVQGSPLIDSLRSFSSLGELSEEIDLAIIATNSAHRLEAVSELLRQKRVENVILEKVLFRSLGEFQKADALFSETGVRAWVNCPKRTYPGTDWLREKLDRARPFRIEVTGNNWGLACNSIHFIDLAASLMDDQDFEVDARNLDPAFQKSKREGYVEFTGTLNLSFKNGTTLKLTSHNSGEPSFQTVFFQGAKTITISELSREAQFEDSRTSTVEKVVFETRPQSDLTQRFAREIFEGGICSLPTYAESARLHRPLLSSLLKHYNALTGELAEILPIT